MRTRRRSIQCAALTVALACTAAAPAAAQIVTRTDHARLGFTGDLAFSGTQSGGGGFDCPEPQPSGAITGGWWSAKWGGEGSLGLAMGADVSTEYARNEIRPGNDGMRLHVGYTPTDDPGPELFLKAAAKVHVDSELFVCGMPNPTSSDDDVLTIAGQADFKGPLDEDAPVSMPVSSNTIEVQLHGHDMVRARVEGTITLAPVPQGDLPGLGAAAALVGANGPASPESAFPLEWPESGAIDTADLEIAEDLAHSVQIRVSYGPLFHWVAVSADVNLIVEVCCGIENPAPKPMLPGTVGDQLHAAGVDCMIAQSIDGGECGGAVGQKVAEAVAAGRIPVPLLDPEIAPIGLNQPFELGAVDFLIDPDADNDRIHDGRELRLDNSDPDDADTDDDDIRDDGEDTDRDGARDQTETSPRDPDSDDDLLSDGCEVFGSNATDPLSGDTDGDGLSDATEDADRDCAHDAGETDPADADSDDDALADGVEIHAANPTDPLNADSDGDGLPDGAEDADGDGAFGAGETNPNNPDTDADALGDGCELNGDNPTNPLAADTDGDDLSDGVEDADRDCARDTGETDPADPDSDDDELFDGVEAETGSDPLNPDSDGDGIVDGEDVEWLQNAVTAAPATAFKAPGGRTALLQELDAIERLVIQGHQQRAADRAAALQPRMDGCGAAPDLDDWIIACSVQNEIRGYVAILSANLGS